MTIEFTTFIFPIIGVFILWLIRIERQSSALHTTNKKVETELVKIDDKILRIETKIDNNFLFLTDRILSTMPNESKNFNHPLNKAEIERRNILLPKLLKKTIVREEAIELEKYLKSEDQEELKKKEQGANNANALLFLGAALVALGILANKVQTK